MHTALGVTRPHIYRFRCQWMCLGYKLGTNSIARGIGDSPRSAWIAWMFAEPGELHG